jgi:hypothetical protein
MRKSLGIILGLLLLAAIGAPIDSVTGEAS